jgi:hypothetical protein
MSQLAVTLVRRHWHEKNGNKYISRTTPIIVTKKKIMQLQEQQKQIIIIIIIIIIMNCIFKFVNN